MAAMGIDMMKSAEHRSSGEHTRHKDVAYVDLEAQALYPEISTGENLLRLGFIRKVYGILAAQLVITTAMVAAFQLNSDLKDSVLAAPGLLTAAAFAPLIGLLPLYCYRHSHPLNLALLFFWTMCIALTTSVTTCFYSGDIVLEALAITTAVTVSLSVYTFVAVRKGADFGYLGPILFAGLLALIFAGFLQLVLPMSDTMLFLKALAGAAIFSMYIVYDTFELIKRYSMDEYVWASVGLYLDIINLFLKMLRILAYLQGKGRR